MFNCLVVDDSPSVRMYMQEVLQPIAQCFLADCGQKALDICESVFRKTGSFDLIIMDIMMPEMDGFETLEEIKKMQEIYNIGEDKKPKVIMLSCLSDPHNMVKAHFEANVDIYLTKPFEHENLYEALINLQLIDKLE